MGIDDRNRDVDFRSAHAAILMGQAASWLPDPGLFPGAAGTVADATSTGTAGAPKVTVQPYRGFVPASTASSYGWVVRSDAAAQVDLDAPNATNPRIDLIVCTVNGTDSVTTRVTGTAAGSPVPPAVPADSIALWEARVATSGAITFTRRYDWITTAGGSRPWSVNTRNGSYMGEKRINYTTGTEDVWLGSWVPLASPAVWSSYTPTLQYFGGVSGTGTFNLGTTGSATGRYQVQGKSLHLRLNFLTGGTGISNIAGFLRTFLPPGFVSSSVSENQILAKLNVRTELSIWAGVAFIPASSNEIHPYFSSDPTNPRLNALKTATSVGATGTGIPQVAGFVTVPGNLYIQGTVEIA